MNVNLIVKTEGKEIVIYYNENEIRMDFQQAKYLGKLLLEKSLRSN